MPQPVRKRNKKCQAAPAVLPLTQGGGAVRCSELQGSSAVGASAIHALPIGKEGATVRCRSQCAASPSGISKPSASCRALPRRHGLRGGVRAKACSACKARPHQRGSANCALPPCRGQEVPHCALPLPVWGSLTLTSCERQRHPVPPPLQLAELTGPAPGQRSARPRPRWPLAPAAPPPTCRRPPPRPPGQPRSARRL